MEMWKYSRCGRTFRRAEQPNCCGKPSTVDEYIAAQGEALQPRLRGNEKALETMRRMEDSGGVSAATKRPCKNAQKILPPGAPWARPGPWARSC